MIVVDETILKYTILTFLWLEYLWELYLSIRQYRKVLITTEIPQELIGTMTKETFDKARSYTIAKTKFGFFKDTFSIIKSSLIIYYGILAIVWDYALSLNTFNGEITTSCIWLFILSTISTFIDLPISIYHTFILEEKFGFNKQTAGFFIWDTIKSFILSQILSMIISSLIIITVKNGGEYFFVWLWLVACIISLILLTIYPSVIAPIFDKYTPLPDGELRSEIEKLAIKLKFPLAQLYVVEGSKRSSHSNAYFYGLFKTKRIVLYDTLIAKNQSGDSSGCTTDEILAVLSHELGHWYHNHVFKNLLIVELNLFLLFAGFNFMFNYSPLYKALGFYKYKPILIGLYVVLQYIMMPYNTLLSFLLTCLSRKFEFQADYFAAKLGKSSLLISSLKQLNKDNLGFPIYDKIYSAWHHSHPPLLERIEALNKLKKFN